MNVRQKWPWLAVAWLVAGAVAVGLAWPLDASVDRALDVTHHPMLQAWAKWCSKMGEGWVPAAVGVAVAILYAILNRPLVAARVFFVVVTCELTGLAGLILRILIGRTRPLAHEPQGIYGIWHHGHWIIGKYEFSAFPSGHAATAVGLAAAAWLVHRGWGTVAAVYALAVMWSRVALQCHHLSDVVASAMLAIPLAMLARKALLPSIEFQFIRTQRRRPVA